MRMKSLSIWWAVSLLAAPLVFAAGDLRLADAVEQGDKEAVRALLREHADVNAPQADGATAIAWAVHLDDRETADLLIQAGADVNKANDYGVTPLGLACRSGNAAMVDKLLQAKANPNAAQWTGETPLMRCASTGSLEGVKLLLAHGANANAKENRKGQTALMWAAANKHSDIVQMLVEQGADVHARSNVFDKPEPFTIPCTVEEPCLDGRREGTSYSPHVHFPKTGGGFTPFLFAAQQGDVESARILLAHGADVNEATPEEGSALVIASASGHEKLALFLLENGADPNAKDGFGMRPLHYALHDGLLAISSYIPRPTDRLGWLRPNMPELVKALLARGADPNARIEHDVPPYDYMPISRSAILNLPQITLAGATPFLLATASGDPGLMKTLVEGRANPTVATVANTTALMIASGMGHERGGITNVVQYEDRVQSAEERARRLETVKLAYDLGAGSDIDAVNEKVQTALHAAVFMGWTDVVKFLAEKGADLNAKDKYGETPVSIAMGDPEGLVFRQLGGGRYDYSFRQPKLNQEMVDLLLSLGAAPFTGKYRDRSGE
jgi:ankyrin repeat protein